MGAKKFATAVRRKGGLWIFHHVPKTAGSSMTRELNFCFPPYYNIHYDNFEKGADRNKGLSEAVDTFLEEHQTRHFQSCSGHLRRHHLKKVLDAVPDSRVFTVLRDPVERLVSEYRYIRTPAFPRHEEMVVKYPDFESYIDDPNSQNKQWFFINGKNPAEPTDKAIRAVLNRYIFVADMSRLDDCFEYISGIAGFPKRTSSHVNKTKDTSSNSVSMSPDLRQRIEDANALDVALYRTVCSDLDQQAEEMREYCDERRAAYI